VLYRPEAFDEITARPWDEGRVRGEIGRIVADADAAYDQATLWPAEEWDGWRSPLPLKTLYVGAAGLAWALAALHGRGHAETNLDPANVVAKALEAWRVTPGVLTMLDLPSPAHAALFHGETGILTVHWLLAPSDEIANELHEHVSANVLNEANDLFWGAPGTMLAARLMLEQTGESRWADVWSQSGGELMRRRDDNGVWTVRLHGQEGRGLGPAHGVVGNVLALRQGLERPDREDLERDTAALLARTAVLEDGLVNWPGRADGSLQTDEGEIRVQWCVGAPGIIVSAADYHDEELLLGGARLIWAAGPHGDEKGASICHGTAGNGYAFLKTFERTGDEEWLDRARRFAMHALEQVERLKTVRGRGRYSLWTGDIGTALFAADCVDAQARYPILDAWE
jgi:hypothetical protein